MSQAFIKRHAHRSVQLNISSQVVEKQVELTDAEIAERFIANNKNLIISKKQLKVIIAVEQ